MSASAAGPVFAVDPHLVLVRFDKVYGKVVCYPVSEAAFALADLARQKTLGPAQIKLARRLGLRVQLMPGSLALLEDFIAGGAS